MSKNDENFEEKHAHKCMNKLNKQQTERWRHVQKCKKFDGDSVEERRKIRWENPQKFIHKLNKQQMEWWRHLVNLSELFFTEIQFGNNVFM